MLGILPTIRIEEDSVALAAGEYLVIYTDGVTDALNNAGEEFGESRLTQTVRRHYGLDATAMLAAIREECVCGKLALRRSTISRLWCCGG